MDIPRGLVYEPAPDTGTRLTRWARGRAEEAAWVRPAVLGLLVLTAVLYFWGLDRNGYANEYYAMAVQAGTQSWKAFFFGALDAGSFITVDKPPASLWLMELSGRIFGFSSWSMLAPQALLGVGTVGLVYAIVRRAVGSPLAGLAAGLAMALTPVAVLMFRFNNPDALLTFLMTAAAWALLRSMWTGRTRWLLVAAALVGLAFDTKFLQAYLVLPALVVTYFLFGPGGLGRRAYRLLAAAGVLIVSSGWWTAIVDAIPAASRPFIGGSGDNTVTGLFLGYDGLGRIFGQGRSSSSSALSALESALSGQSSGGFGGGGAGFGGATGLDRLLNSQQAGEISWLLPFAAVAIVVGIWAHWRDPRTSLARASYVLWGLWLATHFVVFSFMSGIFHSYYTVAIAPAIAGLVGSGLYDLWRLRGQSIWYGLVAAVGLIGTAAWGAELMSSSYPLLGTIAVVLAVVASVVFLAPASLLGSLRGRAAQIAAGALAAGLIAIMLGPAAYALGNVNKSSTGSTPSSGSITTPFGSGSSDRGGFAGGPPSGANFGGGTPPGMSSSSSSSTSGARPSFADGGFNGGGGPSGFGGGTASSALISYLKAHQGSATWLVAVSSAMQGASIQLKSGKAVLVMGGFNGGDSAMTVAKLQALVKSGQLRYVLVSGSGNGGPGGSGSSAVTTWIQQHGTVVNYGSSGGGTLYDLSSAA